MWFGGGSGATFGPLTTNTIEHMLYFAAASHKPLEDSIGTLATLEHHGESIMDGWFLQCIRMHLGLWPLLVSTS